MPHAIICYEAFRRRCRGRGNYAVGSVDFGVGLAERQLQEAKLSIYGRSNLRSQPQLVIFVSIFQPVAHLTPPAEFLELNAVFAIHESQD